MSDELKRCPFCGGEAVVSSFGREGDEHFWIECSNAFCPVSPETCEFGSEADAIAAWNRRVGE